MHRRLSVVLWVVMWAVLSGLPASAKTIRLANGDELNAEVVEWAVDYVEVDHPQLGRIRLPLDQLDLDTGTPPSKGLFGTRFLRGWKRGIDLGWTGRQGSTDTINITASMNFNYSDEFRRWMLTGRYFFNQSTDGDEDNNARIDLRRDWLFPGHRWFAFGAFRYQFDQFESWQHRTIFSVGPGWNVLTSEAHKLDFRTGPTFTKEYSGDRDRGGELLFGVDYDWTLSKRSSVSFSNDYYIEWAPSGGDFRNLTLVEWTLRLTEDPNLNLKIGGSNEYDSTPEPGDAANDLRYYLSVGLGF